jgi:hypothetical protein
MYRNNDHFSDNNNPPPLNSVPYQQQHINNKHISHIENFNPNNGSIYFEPNQPPPYDYMPPTPN